MDRNAQGMPDGGGLNYRTAIRGMKQTVSVDMNEVVGKKDILFICLDTLRYDAAIQEEAAGRTPVLNRYGPWEKCQAPGSFT